MSALSSLSDRLGQLTKDTKKKDDKDEDDKSEVTMSDENRVPKSVIIHMDEKGYGLTVSGDNPVFVQSVKDNGAAAKAGVQKGDRILKVNGTLVTKYNHREVVKLIKSGSYVALTLLGHPSGHTVTSPTQAPPSSHATPPSQHPLGGPGSPAPSPADIMTSSLVVTPGGSIPAAGGGEKTAISGPVAVDPKMEKEMQMQKIGMIRFMYEQECEECEKLTEALRQNPNQPSVQNKLEEKLRIRGRLGDQLYHLTGIPSESHITSPKSPPSGLPPPGPGAFSTPPGAGGGPPRMKRYGSGDGLHFITEDGSGVVDVDGTPNPAPWLAGGPKHRKAESMPESAFSDLPPSGKNITVSRSNSDSRRQAPGNMPDLKDGATTVSADEIEKLRGDITLRRRKMMQKTSSLPSSYNPSTPEQSTNQNTASSPTQSREAWEEHNESALSPSEIESPNTTRGSGTSLSPPRDSGRPVMQVMSPLQADVIPMEEEEEVNMDDEQIAQSNNRFSWPIFPRDTSYSAHTIQLDDHGPFSDLNRLKHKPAHLAVFLYYLISNSDPSPLLFYLVTEQYTQGAMKDLRRWAYEIYSTFLVQSAAIKVEDLDASLLQSIEQTLLHKSDKEDTMRTIFQHVRHMAQKQISELLADFRQKRTLGLANLYGDNELSDNMDRNAETKTVESKLLPHLEKCNRDLDAGVASPRDRAMAWALATIMKQLGVSPNKSSTVLERCQSFISKDKKAFKIGSRSSKKNGHHFLPTHYHSTAYCSSCGTLLWGVGYQGFQCANCDINVHKSCMEQLHDNCTRKKKEKRTSMLQMLRKTTNPNPAAIREAQQNHEEKTHERSHSAVTARDSSMFQIRSSVEEEEELVKEAQRLHEEKVAIAHQRALSMPSIRDAISSATWRSPSSYSNAPLRGDVMEEEELDHLRSSNKVSSMVDQFSVAPRGIHDDGKTATPPRSRSPDTMETDDQLKRKSSTNLGRSESLNKKRENRRSVRRTRSDVHVDDKTLKSLNQSESSSNSSLSNRSLDSPSTSAEALDAHHPALAILQEDSDFEVEPELPPLDATIPKDQLKKLKKAEKKRQEVINELFYTERAHVKNLKVLDKIFRVPLISMFNDEEMINTLFPGLHDLIEVHSKLNNSFKNTRKDNCVVAKVADLILSSFAGEAGEEFKKSCAIFCRDQSHALNYLRSRQRKDHKFATFLQEASSNPLCQRLELKDIIPKAMQRLTKYPLLIDSILKDTSKSSPEHGLLQKAAACSREILHFVNTAVRDRENQLKLEDIHRRLDRRGLDNSKYQNFDLRKFRLIHDDSLTWRINKQKQVSLTVLLLDTCLVLLQKQDDRMVLKYQSTGRDDTNKSTFCPILSLSNLMVRPVATDKHAMFLISDGEFGPQIYELVGHSTESMKRWFKYLSESTADHRQKTKGKGPDGVTSGAPPRPSSMVVPDNVAADLANDREHHDSKDDKKESTNLYPKTKSHSLDALETIEHVEVCSVTDAGLTQPSEVTESTVRVVTAEAPRSLNDRLREQDAVVSAALVEKRAIMAEMMGVNVDDYTNIAEMASEVEGDKDPRELILGSLHQTERMTQLLNTTHTTTTPQEASTADTADAANNNAAQPADDDTTTTNHSTAETAAANQSKAAANPSERRGSVSVPCSLFVEMTEMTVKLNSQLHHLMMAISQREKEQERLQAELSDANAKLGLLLDDQHLRSPGLNQSQTSRPDSLVSMTSSTSEDADVVTVSSSASVSMATMTTTEVSRQVVVHERVVERSSLVKSSEVVKNVLSDNPEITDDSSDRKDSSQTNESEQRKESTVTNSTSSSSLSDDNNAVTEDPEEETFEDARSEDNATPEPAPQEDEGSQVTTSTEVNDDEDEEDKQTDSAEFITPTASATSSPAKTPKNDVTQDATEES